MKPIENIAIVGGGTAGWIAAAILSNQFSKGECRIELVESDQIGTIGVGESTIPPFMELLANLGIDEKDFIRKTQASFKLGISFENWRTGSDKYFHPFGVITAGMNEYNFYQLWLKSNMLGEARQLQDYSPSSMMASQNKFILPQLVTGTPLADTRYALHLDASLVTKYLKEYAMARGVVRTEGKVISVSQTKSGDIASVELESGERIPAEFFIDCTGFNSLILDKTLKVEYEDWTHYLPCDRAVTVQTTSEGPTPPYTRAIAKDAGWMWKIPLQKRTGNGYVYSSRFCSDDQAKQTLLEGVSGQALIEPRVIPFKTGKRKQIWHKNCLGLGLAAGFIEPLESTALHLVVRGMFYLMRSFPDTSCSPILQAEYNRRVQMDYEEIRDFIVLHYCLTERDDTAFWRYCRDITLPDSLQYSLDFFKENGGIPEGVDLLFAPISWRSVCEGLGVRPRRPSPLIDEFDYSKAVATIDSFKVAMDTMIQRLPSHDRFIQDNCAVD